MKLRGGRADWIAPGHWQREPEAASLPGLALDAHVSAVREDDFAREIKPKADSRSRGSWHAEELLENPLPVLRRNARPVILHLEAYAVVLWPRPHDDRTSWRAVADCIADQIVENERDPLRIGEHGQNRLAKFRGKLDPRRRGRSGAVRKRSLDQGLRGNRC